MPRFRDRHIPYSLKSNGIVTGIVIPNSPSLNPTAAVACEIWFKPAGGIGMNVFDNSQAGVTASYYCFITGAGLPQWFSIIGGVTRNITTMSARARLYSWNLVNFVYDGTAVRIMMNGSEVATLAATGALGTNTGQLRIAKFHNEAIVQTGTFTRPRIYSRVFTLQDHKDRYYNNRDDAAMREGLVLDGLLSEGSGAVFTDSSGQGNHGVITGNTWTTDSPFKERSLVTTSRSLASSRSVASARSLAT